MKHDKNIEMSALRIFAAVAQSDTLTQAAEQLGVTQSAVSQTIKQLELTTASELVDRSARPIKLTPSGKVLNEYAVKLLDDTQRMLHDVGAVSDSGFSELSIGMIDSFGDVASLQLMRQFKPMTSKLVLSTGLDIPLSQALVNRDLDILVTSDPFDDHPEFDRHPILRDPFVLIYPDKYKDTQGIGSQWLARNVSFIRYNRRSRIGIYTDLIARRLNVELQTHYELDSTQTLLRFVQSGEGWAIVPALCLIRFPQLLNGVCIERLASGSNARYISLVCRAGEFGSLPATMAEICRSVYTRELVPQLKKMAPWITDDAYEIEVLPQI